jgi:hypothetical protein
MVFRRYTTGLLGAMALGACFETPVMQNDSVAGVRLQVVGNGNNDAEVRVSHPSRGGDSLVVLARQRVVLDSVVRELTVPLDITDCLAAYSQGCPLRIDILLLVDRTVVDSAGVGPVLATGAGVVQVPAISFREATRLVAVQPLVRPRVNDLTQIVVYGIDARGDTMRGRAVTLTSSDTTVAVVADRGRIRALRVGTAAVTATREGLSVPIRVEVTPIRNLAITWPTNQLYETGRDSVRGIVTAESGFPTALRWQSADSTVVRVNATGQLTAGRRGTTTITAIAVADSSQRVSRDFTVEPFQAAARWDFVRTTPAPGYSGNASDFWGTSSSNVWLASSGRLYRWNGSAWTFDATAPCCAFGLDGTGVNDVWAVGNIVQRFDGQRWTTSSFRPARTLFDVWASGTRAWAVGDSGYMATFDGTNWSPIAPITNQPLKRIWGRSATEIYAVGALGTILRFNGTQWSAMTSGIRDTLFALNGDDQVVYAAGWRQDSTGFESNVLQLVNGTWRPVAGRPGSLLYGLWRTDALGWVASGSFGTLDRIVNGALVPGNVEPDIPDREGFSALVGIGFPNGGFLGGNDGTLIQIGPTGRLTLQFLDQRYDSSCRTNDGEIMLGGHLGRVERYSGGTWRSDNVGVRFVRGLWCDTAVGAVAVGNNGSLYRFDGSTWISYVSPAGTTWLRSVWGSGASNVFVGGDNGTILRWNGSTWSGGFGVLPGGMQVFGLYGFAPNDVFAVGTGGRILRFNGTSWQSMASPVTTNLQRVWGTAPNDVWAVGDRQTIVRYDGQQWRLFARADAGTSSYQAIWGSSANDVYIGGCGVHGTSIVRWDGTRFTTVASNSCNTTIVGDPAGGVLLGDAFRSVRRGIAPNGTALVQPR